MEVSKIECFNSKSLCFCYEIDLKITFECDAIKGRWSQPVVDFDIKDRMISFKTPAFPYPITKPVIVNIILRQDNKILGVLKYSYLPTGQYE